MAARLYGISQTIWELLTKKQARLSNTILKQQGSISGNRLLVFVIVVNYFHHAAKHQF